LSFKGFATGAVLAALAAGPAVAEKPRAGCDVTVDFKAKDGRIDTKSYNHVKAWLDGSREITSYSEPPPNADGAVRLCVMATSKDDIRRMYSAIIVLVDRSYGRKAPIRIQNRYGGLYDKKVVKFRGSTPGVPRNNGLPQRPPSDKWN
jgi:hypothetical protein